ATCRSRVPRPLEEPTRRTRRVVRSPVSHWPSPWNRRASSPRRDARAISTSCCYHPRLQVSLEVDQASSVPGFPVIEAPRLRLALGLGDQELEQRFRPSLEAFDDLHIVAQCLAADQLLQLVTAREVDALVVAWSLHRLTDAILDELDRPGVTVVLLV